MFYSRIVTLSKESGTNISNVINQLQLSSGNLSKWKAGGMPKADTISKLADYFHVSTDYLLGRTDDPRPVGEEKPTPAPEDGQNINIIKIAGRDGSHIERKLTDEQMAALKLIIDQLPDATDL